MSKPCQRRWTHRHNACRSGRGRHGRGGPGHRRPPLQAGRGGGGRGHEGRVGCTGAHDYAPLRLVAPSNLEEQKYVNGHWFKFDPAASPPRWNVIRPTAPANNQANVLEFDPSAWMTSSSSSSSSPAPVRRPNLSSGAWPSSQHRVWRHPLAPRHHRYFPLNLASRHDKGWLGRRQHVQAYRKFAPPPP